MKTVKNTYQLLNRTVSVSVLIKVKKLFPNKTTVMPLTAYLFNLNIYKMLNSYWFYKNDDESNCIFVKKNEHL